MSWTVRVRSVLIAEVNVVRSKVPTAKGRVIWHSKASSPTTSESGIQGRANGQHAGVDIVTQQGVANIGLVPPDLDVVLGSLVVADVAGVGLVLRGLVGLAEQVQGARMGDVELLDVLTGANEDVVGHRVVGDGEDGRLDGGEAGAGVVLAHVDGAVGAALQRVHRLLLALGVGGRWEGRGRVAVGHDDRRGETEAEGCRGSEGGEGGQHHEPCLTGSHSRGIQAGEPRHQTRGPRLDYILFLVYLVMPCHAMPCHLISFTYTHFCVDPPPDFCRRRCRIQNPRNRPLCFLRSSCRCHVVYAISTPGNHPLIPNSRVNAEGLEIPMKDPHLSTLTPGFSARGSRKSG